MKVVSVARERIEKSQCSVRYYGVMIEEADPGRLEEGRELDAPSFQNVSGAKAWTDHQGNLWRSGGRHTVEGGNGTKMWYRSDAHRNNLPLQFRNPDNLMGRLDRANGPAIERPNGTKEWYRDGERHREDGPAIARSGNDGHTNAEAYFLFGLPVDMKVVMDPASLDKGNMVNLMMWHPRMLNYFIHRIGSQFLNTMGAKRVERFTFLKDAARRFGLAGDNPYGTLWRIDHLPTLGTVQVVEVVNGTAEPDGTYRHYFLRVPIEGDDGKPITSARDAVAWTYGLTGEQYARLTVRT
ncbi:hypothetical protein HY417_03790 [Candidatus Kaiserbacteria bacterium]|nr:hypothetical protein [Candidatus Kaiserbacteria bacterium]